MNGKTNIEQILAEKGETVKRIGIGEYAEEMSNASVTANDVNDEKKS